MARRKLLFVSPRFLFPADSGGKIRTGQILRGMRGGAFDITLVSPEPQAGRERYRVDLESVCDRFIGWPEPSRGWAYNLRRFVYLMSQVPVSVATDRSRAGQRLVEQELARRPDVVVFDFVHSTVLSPLRISTASVMFTHNVEAEIFRRHASSARGPLQRWIWTSQYRKMVAFERVSLARFNRVVAVSDRDGIAFEKELGLRTVATIPTGVDLEYYAYQKPPDSRIVVFTGAMDWMANIDGISFFIESVWPKIVAEIADARLLVVGRNPPPALVSRMQGQGVRCDFTGFVDDVRPYVHQASAYVIPLRVGGGTRIKAYEAMAMGCPVVSTSIGVEGLPLVNDEHYLEANSATEIAKSVVRLLRDGGLRRQLSINARRHVETHFSSRNVARRFEEICEDAIACSAKDKRALNSGMQHVATG